MQRLTLTQSQVVSGGTDAAELPSLYSLGNSTFSAFQRGLEPSELGVGLVGLVVGTTITSAKGLIRSAALAGVGLYAINAHYKFDFSGITGLFGFASNTTTETVA